MAKGRQSGPEACSYKRVQALVTARKRHLMLQNTYKEPEEREFQRLKLQLKFLKRYSQAPVNGDFRALVPHSQDWEDYQFAFPNKITEMQDWYNQPWVYIQQLPNNNNDNTEVYVNGHLLEDVNVYLSEPIDLPKITEEIPLWDIWYILEDLEISKAVAFVIIFGEQHAPVAHAMAMLARYAKQNTQWQYNEQFDEDIRHGKKYKHEQ